MGDKLQSEGRKGNDALPLGARDRFSAKQDAETLGREEKTTAGPDGPDAHKVAAATTGKP